MPPTDTGLQLTLELLGVFAFALSGGLVAVRRGLDLVGVAVLAWVAGLGGGIIRDVLIGAVPPVGISDWRLVAVAVTAGVLTFAAHGRVRVVAARTRGFRLGLISRTVQALDAVGLAMFCVGGSLKALTLGVAPLPAVVVGVITAVGGGLLRDLLAGQVPEVLRRELYAVPALLGATVVVTAHALGALTDLVLAGSVILVFVIRIVAVALGLNAPTRLRTGEH